MLEIGEPEVMDINVYWNDSIENFEPQQTTYFRLVKSPNVQIEARNIHNS